jgi:CRISPR/Cas system-associated endonuclease Cas1
MTHAELAWEFAEIFEQLSIDRVNEMLAKNVPLETLDFFSSYSESFARAEKVEGPLAQRLPNLLLVGYLLRVLEERLLDEPTGEPDAN